MSTPPAPQHDSGSTTQADHLARAHDAGSARPREYAVIIPAFNEAGILPQTLAAARGAMAAVDPPGELIVVDNHSTDATAQIARDNGARVVFEPHNQISRARNAGARAAGSELLLFLDADTTLTPVLLGAILDAMADGQYVGGGAAVQVDRPVPWPARLALGTWNLYSRLFKEPAGCCLYCTREAFEAVGGFSERVYASEEIWLAKALKRWGKPQGLGLAILADTPVTTSARKVDRPWANTLTVGLVLLFPPAVFFRGLCGFWYRRQEDAAS